MFVIPADRLPAGFAEQLDRPPADPPPPRPASTVVLLRDGPGGPEALLLRRNRSSGFVPGAYVFPGGRVDAADAEPRLLDRADGLDDGADPEPAYWMAAVRESFEEAGVLLARDRDGRPLPDAGRDGALAEWRRTLLDDRAVLADVLDGLDARLALDSVIYFAHWITPIAEPRRYDTRFFLAEFPDACEVCIDAREMTDALWLTPAEALERFRAGRLPMVFPTVATLESLAPFASTAEALDAFRRRPVAPILPRLVRTAEGVGIVIDGDGA
jgi:8-oxo-dGTP pyrophosphatase MutT (NUDIX family)